MQRGDLNRNIGSVEIRSLSDLPGLHQQVQAVATRIRQGHGRIGTGSLPCDADGAVGRRRRVGGRRRP